MLVFPQLSSGAAALYPLRRRTERRTVVNALADGSTVVYGDPDWAVRRWELRCVGLTREEIDAIEGLVGAVRGALGTFTFLEPAGNLLARSEEFDAPEWDNDALVLTTAGIDDPFGGTRATRVENTSGVAAGGVRQTLAVPGEFRYAMSVWARGGVTLTAGSLSVAFADSGGWRRVSVAVNLGSAMESITFGAVLEAGGVVDLFGMQVEAQLAAGAYQRTSARGGVHGRARLDGWAFTARGTDVFDAVVKIMASD